MPPTSSGIEFYVLDTETTGLKVAWNEITQVSCIRLSDKLSLNRVVRCEFPERAQADALRITGKTIEDLKQGISYLEMVDEYDRFFALDGKTPEHRCIIAHNARFDRSFLHATWNSAGKVFPANLWVDTIPMIKNWAIKQGMVKPKVNLENSITMLGSKRVEGQHNASSDARNLFFLYKKLLENDIHYLDYIKRIPHEVDEESTSE